MYQNSKMDPITPQSVPVDSTPILRSPAINVTEELKVRKVKRILAGFYILLIIIGIALIFTGTDVWINFNGYFGGLVDLNTRGISNLAINSIVNGTFQVICALLGFCAFYLGGRRTIVKASTVAGLPLVTGFIFCYVALNLERALPAVLSYDLERSMKHYDGTAPKSAAWDDLQSQVQCCGAQNYTDWAYLASGPAAGFIPESCCLQGISEGCTGSITRANLNDTEFVKQFVFMKGCVEAGESLFSRGYWVVLTIVTGFTMLSSINAPNRVRDLREIFYD